MKPEIHNLTKETNGVEILLAVFEPPRTFPVVKVTIGKEQELQLKLTAYLPAVKPNSQRVLGKIMGTNQPFFLEVFQDQPDHTFGVFITPNPQRSPQSEWLFFDNLRMSAILQA